MALSTARIEDLDLSVYTLRTEQPESDGTFEWDKTICALVTLRAGGEAGIGYTYANESTGRFIAETLAPRVLGRDALDIPAVHRAMRAAVRNLGQGGVSAMAISAVDVALWDLKARLLGLPLCRLLGMERDRVPVYGSGGFTSYSIDQLQTQLGDWVDRGIPRVKMKVGRNPEEDLRRVHAARQTIGATELFVDANGAYTRKQALRFARAFEELGVAWFEEPVSSDDLEGLRAVREAAPMPVAAGEYGYEINYFERMLASGAVDVLQADVTRCGGVTGFLQVAALCAAHHVPLSVHCAPALSLHVACAAPTLLHLEYFHDHVRFEARLFDGVPQPDDGDLRPDLTRPGLGLDLKPEEPGIIVEEGLPGQAPPSGGLPH